MTMQAGLIFPNLATRILSSLIHFLGTAILAFCLARRTAFENLDAFHGWKQLGPARLSIILLFTDSLIFVMFSGILVHGVGLEISGASCSLAYISCIFLYASSKAFIYWFLTEKAWVVWSNNATGVHQSRLRSPLYRVCALCIFLYISCPVLSLCFGISKIRESNGVCYIGLQGPASITLLSYDVYMTLFLTGIFIYPLWKDKVINTRLRRVAIRTMIASLASLATSTVNIAVLTSQHGREQGWICLASCGTDVVINALVIYSVTEGRTKRHFHNSTSNNRMPSLPFYPDVMDLPPPTEPSSRPKRRLSLQARHFLARILTRPPTPVEDYPLTTAQDKIPLPLPVTAQNTSVTLPYVNTRPRSHSHYTSLSYSISTSNDSSRRPSCSHITAEDMSTAVTTPEIPLHSRSADDSPMLSFQQFLQDGHRDWIDPGPSARPSWGRYDLLAPTLLETSAPSSDRERDDYFEPRKRWSDPVSRGSVCPFSHLLDHMERDAVSLAAPCASSRSHERSSRDLYRADEYASSRRRSLPYDSSQTNNSISTQPGVRFAFERPTPPPKDEPPIEIDLGEIDFEHEPQHHPHSHELSASISYPHSLPPFLNETQSNTHLPS